MLHDENDDFGAGEVLDGFSVEERVTRPRKIEPAPPHPGLKAGGLAELALRVLHGTTPPRDYDGENTERQQRWAAMRRRRGSQ